MDRARRHLTSQANRTGADRYAGAGRRSLKAKSLRTRKRIFSIALFLLTLAGTCSLLYSVALPKEADSAQLEARAGNDAAVAAGSSAEAMIRMEAEPQISSAGKISAVGVGRVADNTAQGKLLGRRAALTDARRKLLAQRLKLAGDPRYQQSGGSSSVSGFLPGAQRIKSEGTRAGGVYFVEVEMPLDSLLHPKLNEVRLADEFEDL